MAHGFGIHSSQTETVDSKSLICADSCMDMAFPMPTCSHVHSWQQRRSAPEYQMQFGTASSMLLFMGRWDQPKVVTHSHLWMKCLKLATLHSALRLFMEVILALP